MAYLARKLTYWLKWGKVYSEVCGYRHDHSRMGIAIVRATYTLLAARLFPCPPTSRMSNRRPQWEDKAGLSLFRH
jgi:hypothetical protein